MTKTIKSYKATNMDMTCRDFQFELNKDYHQKGNIETCSNGFHACEDPLDVLDFYDITTSRFFILTLLSAHRQDLHC